MSTRILARYMPTWDADSRPLPMIVHDVPVIVLDEYCVMEGRGQRVAIVQLPCGERRRVYMTDLRAG